MPKTVFENEVTQEYVPMVKQMVRKLGAIPNEGIDMIQMVDAELTDYLSKGWKLSYVCRLATEPDGHTILYVLTKEQ